MSAAGGSKTKLVGISLFSGIGGLDIAAEWCGIEPAVFCEIEPFPSKVLEKRWKDVPNVGDIRKFTSRPLAELGGSPFHSWKTPQDTGANVVYGGFPCQDLSVAGQQKGLVDEHGQITRSGLWYEMLRVIREARPDYVVGENVRGSVNLALDQVKEGLEREGYAVYPSVVPASAFGAPHKRERLFVLAVRKDKAQRFSEAWARLQEENGGDKNEDDDKGAGMPPVRFGGLWRTPDAGCGRGPSFRDRLQMKLDTGNPISLNDQVAHTDMFSGIATDGTVALFPTPVKEDWRRRGPSSRQKGLPEVIYEMSKSLSLYPTPTVHGNHNRKGLSPTSNDGLATALKKDGVCGSLSPDWVSVLMGYPEWWTNISCEGALKDWDWIGFPAPRNAKVLKEAERELKTSLLDPVTGQYFWEPPRTMRNAKDRIPRIKALGNAVVPQQALFVFLVLAAVQRVSFTGKENQQGKR